MMTKDKGRFFQRYEQLELLCKRVIDAPDSVDANTRGELQEAAAKYANALNPEDPQQVFEVLYDDQDGIGRLVREAVEIVGKARDDQNFRSTATGAIYPRSSRSFLDVLDEIEEDAEDNGDDDDAEADISKAGGHHELAASLVNHLQDALDRKREAHGFTKADTATKEGPMDRIEGLTNAMKGGGMEKFSKALVANNSDGVSEWDLTEAATRYAKSLYPDLNGPAAFSRLYESDVWLRKAVQVSKWPAPMSLEPMVATGASGFPSARIRSGSSPGRGDDAGDVDAVGTSDAYGQLMKLAEQQRRNGESSSQAFERVFTDPVNKELAAKAHRRPAATTYYEYPR
jgi:hypothetical protein